jgi:hypothetical protein
MIIGSNRVLRGGSWNNNAQNVRTANRNNNTPSNRNNNIGFRVLAPAALEKGFPKQIISGWLSTQAVSRRRAVSQYW